MLLLALFLPTGPALADCDALGAEDVWSSCTAGCLVDGQACDAESDGGESSSGEPAASDDLATVYTGHGPATTDVYPYGEALQMTWAFYELQRSGPLPEVDGDLPFDDPVTGEPLHDGFLASRFPWRGDSALDDGADAGVDLSGGWYDAGDHVKFGLPMAFATTMLAWGVLEFEGALDEAGALERARDNLRWAGDYLVRAHPEAEVFYAQVGDPDLDHPYWGPPELMDMDRPTAAITASAPGPDLAAQASAALAALSLVFADEPAYSAALLARSESLYTFAQDTRDDSDPTLGCYADSVPAARAYYDCYSGAQDDLPFAAAWLYKATGEAAYLDDAEADYDRVSGATGWTAVWDDVRYGLYILMAELTGEARYDEDARDFLGAWLDPDQVQRTPGGMAWLSTWASGRYSSMTAFLALLHRQWLLEQGTHPNTADSYLVFATEQVNYLLGDNPEGISYVVGFGEDWSTVAHHRASHGSTVGGLYEPELPRFVLYGGLAGGPDQDDAYTTDRGNYVLTEVSLDINAGLTGALAGLVHEWGPTVHPVDPDFPPEPEAVDELYVEAILLAEAGDPQGTAVELVLTNETAFPPRETGALRVRWWVDLGELSDLGLSAEDVVVDVWYEEGFAVAAPAWHSGDLYYVEATLDGRSLAPVSTTDRAATAELFVRLPWESQGWQDCDDPSLEGLDTVSFLRTEAVTVYDDDSGSTAPVWGAEPDAASPTWDTCEAEGGGGSDGGGSDGGGSGSSGGATVTVEAWTTSQWDSGYCVELAVWHDGDTAQDITTLGFELATSTEIYTSWNGERSQWDTTHEVALPDWAWSVAPGETATDFGYCANGQDWPTGLWGE